MKTILISRKEELLPYRDEILALFSASFDSNLSAAVWTWAYIENPAGQPVVALCHDGGRLVGHYAVIPMPVINAGRRMNSFLSMTTMVAPSHRGFGLFVSLARAVYERAGELGADYVFGFPNRNSTPGFRKHLGWLLPEPDHIVTFEKPALISFARSHSLFDSDQFSIDLQDDKLRRWRLSKPGVSYESGEGLVVKPFGDAVDLVWCSHDWRLAELPDDRLINVLLASRFPLPDGCAYREYQFGGVPLMHAFDPSLLARCMLLSDVF